MIRRKIEQILANENKRINVNNVNQNSLSNNLLAVYFLDNIPDKNLAIDDLIINDFLYKFISSEEKNKIYNLNEVISKLSKVDENQVNKSKSKKILMIPKINIQMTLAIDSYLDLIKNEESLEIITGLKSKDDLKALLLIDRISGTQKYSDLEFVIDKKDCVEKNAIIAAKYSTELSALSKSDSNLKSSYQILNNLPSDFTLTAIKQIKKINQEVTDSSIDYKIISKNPKLIKKINAVKGRYNNLKRRTSSWLDKELNIYLEKEYKKINFNISRMTDLDLAIEKTDNASRQLNKIKNKYKAAGITPAKFNKKYSQLSAQQNKLKSYNVLKKGFVKNCAIIKRERQLIEDKGVDDIADLVSLINKEKNILNNADISETKFSDLDTAKQDYINESKRFKDAVNLEISSIKQYLNHSCDILIEKAGKYTGLSGLFGERDKESLVGLKDEAKSLADQILLVKKEFGIPDYVIQKSNELSNLVDKLIKKNKYTISQKLKRGLSYKYAEAGLLVSNYLPSKEIIGASVFSSYLENDKYNIIQKGNKTMSFEQNLSNLPPINDFSSDYMGSLKQSDNKTARKTYGLASSRKGKRLINIFAAGLIFSITSLGIYGIVNPQSTYVLQKEVETIEKTEDYSSIHKPEHTIYDSTIRDIDKIVDKTQRTYESTIRDLKKMFNGNLITPD
ncbi:MAG: hypothetical protein U9R34_04160 [Nanoarchaeota archaeon]|nr:hypothetical protein [Nanoarchaeota archaeon]